MSTDFIVILNEFDEVLRTFNESNYQRLLPPLIPKEIESFLDLLGVSDKDFNSLYLWKNGIDITEDDSMLNKATFLEFGKIISLKDVVDFVNINKNEISWPNTFVPIVTNSDGEFILFNNEKGQKYGKLYLYSAALLFVDEPVEYYDSLSSMLITTCEAYKSGALKYDKNENWLNVDSKEYRKIASRINIASEYWRL